MAVLLLPVAVDQCGSFDQDGFTVIRHVDLPVCRFVGGGTGLEPDYQLMALGCFRYTIPLAQALWRVDHAGIPIGQIDLPENWSARYGLFVLVFHWETIRCRLLVDGEPGWMYPP